MKYFSCFRWISPFIIWALIIFPLPRVYAQQIPLEQISPLQTSSNEQTVTNSSETPLIIPVDSTLPSTAIPAMELSASTSMEAAAASFAELFDGQNIEEVVQAFIDNGYSLLMIAEILQGAGIDVEQAFVALMSAEGDPEVNVHFVVAALMSGGFNINSVFKTAIVYLQDQGITDDAAIVEAILGEDVDAAEWKTLMTEIYMEKMNGVSITEKAQIFNAMLEAGFGLQEITNAFMDNGFSLDDVASIFAKAEQSISVAYQMLLASDGGQERADVFQALLQAGYEDSDVVDFIVTNFSWNSVSDLLSEVLGEIDAESGPTFLQIKIAGMVIAKAVETLTNTNWSDGVAALDQAGFSLEQIANVLSKAEASVDEALQALWSVFADSGMNLIMDTLSDEGYDAGAVLTSAVQLLYDGNNADTVVAVILGTFLPGEQLTSAQISLAAKLVTALLEAGGTPDDMVSALNANGIDLTLGAAKILNYAGVDIQDAFDAFTAEWGAEAITEIFDAMLSGGFKSTDLYQITVDFLINESGFSAAQIITALVGPIDQQDGATSNQLKIAKALAKELLKHVSSSVVVEELMQSGFSLPETAQIIKTAGIGLTEAYDLLAAADGGQSLADVAAALMNSGYNYSDIYAIVVPNLFEAGESITTILTILLGPIDQENGISSTQKYQAKVLAGVLLESFSLGDFINESLQWGFSLTQVAQQLRGAQVSLADTFDAMISAGQDIGSVTLALFSSGYNKTDLCAQVVDYCVQQLSYSADQIIAALIGNFDPEAADATTKRNLARSLTAEMLGQFSSTQVAAALLNSDFSIAEVSGFLNAANLGLSVIFSSLLEAAGADSLQEIAMGLISTGFTATEVLSEALALPDLVNAGVSDIIARLLGAATAEGPLVQYAGLLVKLLCEAEVNVTEICAAFLAAGYDTEILAAGMQQAGVSLDNTFNALYAAVGSDGLQSILQSLLNAGFGQEEVCLAVITELRNNEGYSAEQVIIEVLGTVDPGTTMTLMHILFAASFSEQMQIAGYSMGDIVGGLQAAGFNENAVAEILSKLEISVADAFGYITQGVAVADAVGALINAGYSKTEVIDTAVAALSDSSATEIIALVLGPIDQENGPSALQKGLLGDLITAMSAGDFDESVTAAALLTAGFDADHIAVGLKSADYSAADAFSILFSESSGLTAQETLVALINGGYGESEVFAAAVTTLAAQDFSPLQIISELLGEVPQEGATDSQKTNGGHLMKALREQEYSLTDITNAFFSHGFGLETVAQIFKNAAIDLENAYNELLNAGGGQEIRDLADALIDAGYTTFDVYNRAVTYLKNVEELTDQQIVEVLVGTVDVEDATQVTKAEGLAEVLEFHEFKATIENTVESFLEMMKEGFSLQEIIIALTEKGVAEADVMATFDGAFDEIVKELVKDGKTALQVVNIIMSRTNVTEYAAKLTEQLILNDVSYNTIQIAFWMGIGWSQTINDELRKGKAAAGDYALEDTDEAALIEQMLADNVSLTDICAYFADQGYNFAQVVDLFNALYIDLEQAFSALYETQDLFHDAGQRPGSQIILDLINKGYAADDVFTVAAAYLKDVAQLDAQTIAFQLTSARVNLDSVNVLTYTLTAHYAVTLAQNTVPAFFNLMTSGFTMGWIKSTLVDKGIPEADIDALITTNLTTLFDGLMDQGMYLLSVIRLFSVQANEAYVAPLAAHMIGAGIDEEIVRSSLLHWGADPDEVETGILQGLG